MNSKIVIQLTNISKQYTIHHEKPTLVEKFVKGRQEKFWALKNINLSIKKGERVGIIGPNGSGKTTLLKIMAGIAAPSAGRVQTQGKIVSLIDLTAGFHPDLSGISNIYINGLILGLTRKQIDARLERIISYSGLDKFIDVPLFQYSSGMILRLGFSVAVHADPDIIILDENLSVGDIKFQQQIQKTVSGLFKRQITFIMVSHWPKYLRAYCSRFVRLENGAIAKTGGIKLLKSIS